MDEIWNLLTFLAVLLAPSLSVIIYFLLYRPVRSCQDFMYGKYAIHYTCVGASLAGSCLGPMTLFWPSEFLKTGTTWPVGAAVGFLLASVCVAIVHAPVLHYNRSCSIYQYLEDRFRSKSLRYIAFAFYILSSIVFCIGILSVSAELAQRSLISTVIGAYAKRWMCILALSALTGISAVVGGQKSAVFLSTFTLIFELFVALICAIVMGLYKSQNRPNSKNDGNANDSASQNIDGIGDRFLSSITPNYHFWTSPQDHASIVDNQNVWLITCSCFVYFFYALGCNQTSHQHYSNVHSKKGARLAIFSSTCVFILLWTLTLFLICLILRFYMDPDRLIDLCFGRTSVLTFSLLSDPYTSLLRFFSFTWTDVSGACGYFLGCFTCVCVFSTLPSYFVSLSTCMYEDLFKPYYCMNSDESKRIWALKFLAAIFASASTIGALLISEFCMLDGQFWWLYAKNVWLTVATWSAPMAGLFVLAIWLPCTNSKGALCGLICGFSICVCLSSMYLAEFPYDSYVQNENSIVFLCCDPDPARYHRMLDTAISNRSEESFSDLHHTMHNSTHISSDTYRSAISCSGYEMLKNADLYKSTVNTGYRLSLPLQSLIAFVSTISIGLLISLITGRQDIYALDWNLVYWTCNSLETVRFGHCFGTRNGSVDGQGAKQCVGDAAGVGHQKKKRRQRGPYTTSESFRYSKQGPFPDTSYLNPKVQDYMATLTRTNI